MRMRGRSYAQVVCGYPTRDPQLQPYPPSVHMDGSSNALWLIRMYASPYVGILLTPLTRVEVKRGQSSTAAHDRHIEVVEGKKEKPWLDGCVTSARFTSSAVCEGASPLTPPHLPRIN